MNIRADSKKAMKQRAKELRLGRLYGRDLCACGSTLKCDGICRETHSNGVTVSCTALYRLDPPKRIDKKRGNKRGFTRSDSVKSDKEVNRDRFREKRLRGKG